MKTQIGVNGAGGRMGQRIVRLVLEDPDLELAAALESSGHADIGRDAGEVAGGRAAGVAVTDALPISRHPNVMIDFSQPAGTMALLPVCVARRIPLVVATTGHTPAQQDEIKAAAHHTAILMAPNMSVAVNVLLKLVEQAATLLRGRRFDVEIIDRHHRFKKDAPSGTAILLGKLIQEAMGQTSLQHGRHGLLGERPEHEIGIHSLRAGDNVGEHTIVFEGFGEALELTHRSHARDCYARGALQAAKFLADRPPGWYSMDDVLGI